MKYALVVMLAAIALLGARLVGRMPKSIGNQPAAAAMESADDTKLFAVGSLSPNEAARLGLNPLIQSRVEEVLAEKERAESSDISPSASSLVPPSADLTPLPVRDSAVPFAETSADLPPIHPAPKHPEMLTPGNFHYLGAFRPPHIDGLGKSFAYGGWGIAFRPDGDPLGMADGFAGSLFIVGHHNEQLVAEISIPVPQVTKRQRMDDLPVADVLQNLGDISGGIRLQMTDNSSQPFEFGGLLVSGDRLLWTIYRYYNAESYDFHSHGASSLDIGNPAVQGPWHLGPINTGRSEWQAYKHAGYMFDVPEAYADQWFGGRRFISGLQIATGLQTASHGPAMFAWQLPKTLPPAGSSLDAVPLVWNDLTIPTPGFHPADRFTGGAWLTLGNKQSVIIVGRKALGAFYYGDARPQDCTPDKGYHGPPYEAQVLFYAPASLVRSAHGALSPTGIVPWSQWDQNTAGGGIGQYLFPTCSQHLGGIAWDREHQLLYVCQINAGATAGLEFELLPAIHVFRLRE